MIKFIASDVDGTLIQDGSNKNLSPKMFDLIRECRRRGIQFAVASGRQYHNLKQVFSPVWEDIYFLSENGNLIMHRDQVVHKTVLPKEMVQKIVRDIMDLSYAEIKISTPQKILIPRKADWFIEMLLYDFEHCCAILDDTKYLDIEDIICISANVPQEYLDEATAILKSKWEDQLLVNRAGGGWIDVSLTGKGAGIRRLALDFGVTRDEIMVFGDNYNDEEMLVAVDHSYAMSGADDYLKQKAAYTTDTVEEAVEYYLTTGTIKA